MDGEKQNGLITFKPLTTQDVAMRFKRLIFGIVLLCLLAVNGYIIQHRNEGYKYHAYKTYPELYVTDSSLYLKELHFVQDTLHLLFSRSLSASGYALYVDSSLNNEIIYPSGVNLHIPVKLGLHTYSLKERQATDRVIVIKAEHAATSADHPYFVNEFLYCNLPGPDIQPAALLPWVNAAPLPFSEEEKQKGIELLKKETAVFKTSSSYEQALELARFITRVPNAADGKVAGKLQDANGWQQIETAFREKVKLDCGNYSKMVTYLCTIAGLPNRIVTYFGPNGNWSYGVHYFNEVYLKEKEQWAILDGMMNVYLPGDSLRLYNAADLKKIVATNSFTSKTLYRGHGGILLKLPADSAVASLQYYNQTNAAIVYTLPQNGSKDGILKRMLAFYIFDQQNLFYSDVNRNHWDKIILKTVCFYGFWLIAAAWIMTELLYRHKQKKTYSKTP